MKLNGFNCEKTYKTLKYNSHNNSYDINVELGNRYSSICIEELNFNPEDITKFNWQSNVEFPHSMYVHELQHALRLCGLNELADNLKIKMMKE